MLKFPQRTRRAALALLFVLSAWAPPALSQHLGDVSLTTTTQTLASAVSCTGNPQNFPVSNLGQSFHLATGAILTGAVSFVMEVDGVDAVGNVFKISNPMITVGTQSFLVQGTGFMPIIRISLTCTAGSTFSLSYSGSFAANTIANIGAGGSGNSTSTVGNNVQGIIPQGQNGAPIFPVIGGGTRPAINAGTVQFGVDTFGAANGSPFSSFTIGAGANGVFTLKPPIPTAPGEWGLAIMGNTNPAITSSLLGPWSCITGASCIGNTSPEFAQLSLGTNNNLGFNLTNGNGAITTFGQFVLFSNVPAVRQNNAGNFVAAVSTTGNTLAGSVIVVSAGCSTTSCNLAPTSSQGQVLQRIGQILLVPTGGSLLSMANYILGPTSAAALTVTWNAAAGSTVSGSSIVELTGLATGNLNTPSFPLAMSNPGFIAGEDDPGGLFVNTAGFDYTQTVTLTGAATFTFPLWAESQHGLLESCTVSLRVTAASGTTPTLNTFLQDSPDNVGFNDRLSLPQGTVAASFLGAVPRFTAGSLAATASSAVTGTDGALAAGSGIAGNMAAFGRIKFVVGGTTPSFTVTYNVACR